MTRKIKIFFVALSTLFVGGVFSGAYFSDSVSISGNSLTTGVWSVTPSVTTSPTGPSAGDVVINELMWMGSTVSSDDEWIELRNMTSSPVDISGWEISKLSTSEVLMLTIPSGSTIAANGYFLISKFDKDDANSALNVNPDIISTVGLRNSSLQIKLYSGSISPSTLIDTADDGSGIPLKGYDDGISGPRQSMSRNSTPGDGTQAVNWTTDTTYNSITYWDSEGGNYGTPGGPNV
jgi:hypothetical protein